MFVLDADGRIVRENDPDDSEGPRLAVLGCAEGNLAFVRQGVARADELVRIAATAPPWFEGEAPPAWADELADRLSPTESVGLSLVFTLPHAALAGDPRVVCSGTREGDALLARLRRDGVPAHLVEAGFVGLDDFWAPWCVRLDDGEVAAMAFAARLGAEAAEIGVYTFPRWRGRGFAAAVTAAWSGLPELRGRELFYSCLASNASSRRVAARLALERIGMSLRIA